MIRTLITTAAFAAALSFSGASMAQTMINGMEVSPDDLPKVQTQCDKLALDENGSPATDDNIEKSYEEQKDVSQIDELTTTIDLESLTLEQCKEAGLITM